MQCKDILDIPILTLLAIHPETWHSWWGINEYNVKNAMPNGINDKLVLAKMKMLIRRDLVGGCACGCRGDFVITKKGLDYIKLNTQE